VGGGDRESSSPAAWTMVAESGFVARPDATAANCPAAVPPRVAYVVVARALSRFGSTRSRRSKGPFSGPIPGIFFQSPAFPKEWCWLAWHLQADRLTTRTAAAAANRRSVTNVCCVVFLRACITSASEKIC
jgi:hypothetical protein